MVCVLVSESTTYFRIPPILFYLELSIKCNVILNEIVWSINLSFKIIVNVYFLQILSNPLNRVVVWKVSDFESLSLRIILIFN